MHFGSETLNIQTYLHFGQIRKSRLRSRLLVPMTKYFRFAPKNENNRRLYIFSSVNSAFWLANLPHFMPSPTSESKAAVSDKVTGYVYMMPHTNCVIADLVLALQRCNIGHLECKI